jgi:hypothetical protein
MKDWDKILDDFAHKCGDGGPDMTNPRHLALLRESLIKFGWKENATNEFIGNLREGEEPEFAKAKGGKFYVRNRKSKSVYTVVKPNPKTHEPVSKEVGEKESKGKKVSTKTAPNRGKYDKRWEDDDTSETIEEKVTGDKAKPRDKTVREPKQVRKKAEEHRKGVFNGEITGKGGGDTTAQEEMCNLSREIANNPDKYPPKNGTLEEKMWYHIKTNYPDGPYAEDEEKTKGLISLSTGGAKTMENVKTKDEYDYGDEQPEDYPVNTTDGDLVKDLLLNQLESAEKELANAKTEEEREAAKKKISHYKEELYWFQRKATDKSVTGKEGDADTMMIYKDKQGNDRVVYITNKQTEADTISNSTIETTKQSILEHMDKSLSDTQQTTVTDIAEEQASEASTYNEDFAKRSGGVFNRKKSREQLTKPKTKKVLGKAITMGLGRSQYGHDDDSEASQKEKKKYVKEALKSPEVKSKMLGGGEKIPKDPTSDKYKEWKKDVNRRWLQKQYEDLPEEWQEYYKEPQSPTKPSKDASKEEKKKYKEDLKEYKAKHKAWTKRVENEHEKRTVVDDDYAGEVMIAVGDATGEGNLTSVGTGSASAPYSMIKAVEITGDLRERTQKCIDGGNSLAECASIVANQKDPNASKKERESEQGAKPLYRGKFTAEDIIEIYENKELKKLEKQSKDRGRALGNMYHETTQRLREEDAKMREDLQKRKDSGEELTDDESRALDSMNNGENGPHEKSYVAGYLERTHLVDYAKGDVDGRVVGEMGPNSHEPEDIRHCLAKLTGLNPPPVPKGDDFVNHLTSNVKADEEKQQLVYVKSGKIIGKDIHRTAGKKEKMAGHYGEDLVKCLKEMG